MMTWIWVLLAAAMILALFYALFILPTQWLKVERVHWNQHLQTKILQISDIHIARNRTVHSMKRTIQRERPDYIFLTGDYVEKDAELPLLIPFLDMIQSFAIPMYAVLGNHDYALTDIKPLIRMLETHGIRVLRNECVSLPEFELIGIDDYRSRRSNVEAAFKGVEEGRLRFVITHDPTIVLTLHKPFDALISGHLHGRQFNLPYLFLLKPMGKLAAKGIYKGMHRGSQGPFYISKGCGQSGLNLRLFVRSEVTIHYF